MTGLSFTKVHLHKQMLQKFIEFVSPKKTEERPNFSTSFKNTDSQAFDLMWQHQISSVPWRWLVALSTFLAQWTMTHSHPDWIRSYIHIWDIKWEWGEIPFRFPQWQIHSIILAAHLHTFHLAHWVEIRLWSPPWVFVSLRLFIVAPRTHSMIQTPSHTLHFFFNFIRPYLSANTSTLFMYQLPRRIIPEFRMECCWFGSRTVVGDYWGRHEVNWGSCSLDGWMQSMNCLYMDICICSERYFNT